MISTCSERAIIDFSAVRGSESLLVENSCSKSSVSLNPGGKVITIFDSSLQGDIVVQYERLRRGWRWLLGRGSSEMQPTLRMFRRVCEVAHRPLRPVLCLPSSGGVVVGNLETLRRLNKSHHSIGRTSDDIWTDGWEVSIAEQIGIGCSVKRGILSCSPDEMLIASAHVDGTVTIHSCSDGSFISTLDSTTLPLSGDGRWVVAIHFITDARTSENLCVVVIRLGGVADGYSVSNGELLWRLDLKRKKRGGNGSDHVRPITAACIANSRLDQGTSILFASDSNRVTMWRISKTDPWTSSFAGDFVAQTYSLSAATDSFVAIPLPATYLSDRGVDGAEEQLLFPPPQVQAIVSPSGDLIALLDLLGNISLFTICELESGTVQLTKCMYIPTNTTHHGEPSRVSHADDGFQSKANSNALTGRAVSMSWWSTTSLIATTAKGGVLLMDISARTSSNDNTYPSVVPTPFMGGKTRNSQLSCQGSGLSAILSDDAGGVLLCVDQVSPRVALERYISRGNLEDAESFAKEHDLGQGAVHRGVWERAARVSCDDGSSSLTVDHVNHLQKIEDNEWVVDQAITQVPNSIDASLALINEGLKRVEVGDLGANVEEKLIKSKYVVEAYQLLSDYMSSKLLPLPSRAETFGSFRILPSVPMAAVCAIVGCIPALSKLFSDRELVGWHLRLLAWIPELMHPREYMHLLVGCEASEFDSSSTGGYDNRLLLDLEVEEDKNSTEGSAYSAQHGCLRSMWCEQRAVEVVCGGSHLLHGVELCETGLELLPNLDANEEKQEQWHNLVRGTRSRLVRLRNALWNLNCLIVDGRVNACTLPNTQVKKWILEMTAEEWGLAIFANSTPETIAEDVQFYVESLLDPRSGRALLRKGELNINASPNVDVDAVLMKSLIRQVNSSNRNEQLRGIQLAASVVLDSKPTIALDRRIIKNHSHLANIVLEVAYSEMVNDLNILWQMVECIPVEGEGWSDTDGHAQMDTLERDLIVADILSRYDQSKIPVDIRVARNKGGKHWLDFRLHQLGCMSKYTCTGPEALNGLFEDVATIVTRGGFSIEGPAGSKLTWSPFLRRALLDEDFATAWKIMKAVEVGEEVVTADVAIDQCSEELELDKSRLEKDVEEEGGRWIESQLLEAVRVLINDAPNVLSPKLKTADQCLALLEQGLGQQHLPSAMSNALHFERDLLKLCLISDKFGLGSSPMSDPSYLRMLLMEQKGTENDESRIVGPLRVLETILTQATHAIDLDDVVELVDCIGVTSVRLPEAYIISSRSVLSTIINGRRPIWLCFNCLQYAFTLCKGGDLSSPARSALEDILVMLASTYEENNNEAELDEAGNYIDVPTEGYKCQIFALAMNCCHPHDVGKLMDAWHKSGLASDNDSITIDSLLDMASEGLDEVMVGDGDVAMTLSALLATGAPLKVLKLLDEKIKACKDVVADVEGDDVRRGIGRRTRIENFDSAGSYQSAGASVIENQNEALVAALQKHGFSISLSRRAAHESTGSNLSTALQWCLDHSGDVEDDKLEEAVHPLLSMSDNSVGNIRSMNPLQGSTDRQQCPRGKVGLCAIKEAFQCLDAIEEVSAKERAAMAPAPVYTADLEVLVHIVASFAETTSALHGMIRETPLPLTPLEQPSTTSSSQEVPSSSVPEQLEGFDHSPSPATMHADNHPVCDSASSMALARLLPQYLPGARPLNFVADVTYRSTCISDLVKRAFISECRALPLAIVLAQDMGGSSVTPLDVCKDALLHGLIIGEERESDALMSILKTDLHEDGFALCAWDILVSNPQEFLSFLWKAYDTIDGKALSRLSTVQLLTLNVLSASKRESGLSLVQAKAIRANQGLLRRLIKVGVADLDFKYLVGPDPSQWGICDSTELREMAIMELRSCLDPSHVSAVSKLASRLGGLSASDIYMATATRVLCGVAEDVRCIEGLDRLKSPSLDAPEDVWHSWVESFSSEEVQSEALATSATVVDVLEPFIQKFCPKDAICFIEGVCIPGKEYDWCSVTRGAEEEGRQHVFLRPLRLDPKPRQKLVSATLDVIRRKGGNDGEWNGEDVVRRLSQFLVAVAEVWPSHSHVVEMAWRNRAEGIKTTLIRLVKLGGLSVRTIKRVSDALVLSCSENDAGNFDKECFMTVPEVYRAAIEEDLDFITTQLECPEDEITLLVNNLSQVYALLLSEDEKELACGDHDEMISAAFTACNTLLRNFCTTFKAGEASQVLQRRLMVLEAVSEGGVAPWDKKRYGQQEQTGDHAVVMNGGGSIVEEKLVEKTGKSAVLVAEGSSHSSSELAAPPTLEDERHFSVRIQAAGLAAVELISRHFSLAPSPKQCSSWQGRLEILKEITEIAGDSLPQLRVMCDVLSCWLSEDESVEEGQYHYERDLLALRQWVGAEVEPTAVMETMLEDEGGNTNTLTPLESTTVYVLETLAERFAWTLVQDIFSAPLMQMVLSRLPQTVFISGLLSRADCDNVSKVRDEPMTSCPPLHIVVSAALSSRYADVQRLVRNRIRILHPEVWNTAPELPNLLLGSCILSESFGISTFPVLLHCALSHSSVRGHDVDNVGHKINGGDCYDAATVLSSATSITQTPAYLITAFTCKCYYGPAGAILLEVLGIGRKMRSFDLALHWLGAYMSDEKLLPAPSHVPEMQQCWGEMRKQAAIMLAETSIVE